MKTKFARSEYSTRHEFGVGMTWAKIVGQKCGALVEQGEGVSAEVVGVQPATTNAIKHITISGTINRVEFISTSCSSSYRCRMDADFLLYLISV